MFKSSVQNGVSSLREPEGGRELETRPRTVPRKPVRLPSPAPSGDPASNPPPSPDKSFPCSGGGEGEGAFLVSDIIRDLQLPRCPRPHPSLPPAPARPPTPLSSHPGARGPGRLGSPARRPPALNLRRRPLGPRAACTPGSGPAGPATGDWLAPALPASYLPRLGRPPGQEALPASRGTPGSPHPPAVRAPPGSGPGRG